MKNTTPLLPGLHLQTLRKTPRTALQIMLDEVEKLKQKSFAQLAACFRDFIPSQFLPPAQSGTLSRRRTFSKENTFWAFFSQVLDEDRGYQGVLRKIQACTAMKSQPMPSSSTSAYCQARAKLELGDLESVLQHTSNQQLAKPDFGAMNGRRGKTVTPTI